MLTHVADFLEERFKISPQRTETAARFLVIAAAAIAFALCCTFIVAFDDIFMRFNSTANLGIGRVPTEDIITREEGSFISAILTEQERTPGAVASANRVQPGRPRRRPPTARLDRADSGLH